MTIRNMAYESFLVLDQFVPIFLGSCLLENPLWILCRGYVVQLLMIMTIVEGRDMPLTCNYLRFLVTTSIGILEQVHFR